MELLDRKRIARSEVSNMLCRSTFHLSAVDGIVGPVTWQAVGQRHVVGIGTNKYVTGSSLALRRRAMAEPNLQKGSTDPAVRDLQEADESPRLQSGVD